MATKLLYLLAAFLLAGTAMGQSDSQFVARFNLTSDEVARRVQELDNPSPQPPGPRGPLGVRPPGLIKPKGCRSISVVVRAPNTYYNPVPKRSVCSGPCPHGQICTPFKTVTRNFKVLVFRRFNCWGLIIWLPIGIRHLCITDEFNCQCKPKCKPLICFHPRFFNPTSCDCECPKKFCKHPYEVDPSSCQCRCPKNIVCRHPKILNHKTCKCICQNKCKLPFIQDPRTCKCICQKRCPRGSYLDRRKCQCVGDCKDFRKASDCKRVDSCSDNRARSCRYFPSFPQNPCRCNCCVRKNPRSRFDCGSYSTHGQHTCQFYYDHQKQSFPCKWGCN